MDILFWLVILIIAAVVELHTHAMVAVFVALGALVAGIVSLFSSPFLLQAIVWLAASALLLITLRSEALKLLNRRTHPVEGTSTHSPLVGQRGLVTKDITDSTHPGTITLRSEPWRALADIPITTGTAVIVRKVSGTTLWVEPDTRPLT